jgi:hypothetical protein
MTGRWRLRYESPRLPHYTHETHGYVQFAFSLTGARDLWRCWRRGYFR